MRNNSYIWRDTRNGIERRVQRKVDVVLFVEKSDKVNVKVLEFLLHLECDVALTLMWDVDNSSPRLKSSKQQSKQL
jgi:hypothetical protein